MFLVFENKMENKIDPLKAAHKEFINFVDKIFISYLFEDFG
jgi:c-di-GMP-related signal transduction protein